MDPGFRAPEAQIAVLRKKQAVIVNEFEKASVAAGAGCRSTVEYLSGRFDVSRAAAQRRVSCRDERSVVVDRFVSIQPTLDESSWRLSGLLRAVDGRVVERALVSRGDEKRLVAGGGVCTRGRRQADGLVAMAMDSLDRTSDGKASRSGSSVSVVVGLDAADGSGGEHGACPEYGPRVDPAVLDELWCPGSVQMVGLSGGLPVVTSAPSRQFAVAVRRFVAHRDGGAHDPTDGETYCWFHHHVAIHQLGFRIDPDSAPKRRRLIRSAANTDPPHTLTVRPCRESAPRSLV